MGLNAKQCEFSLQIAYLRIYADSIGCGLTYGDAYATSGHMVNSNHYKRLAVDWNLIFFGEYIQDGDHLLWVILHDYWESIGGAPMIVGDENHFSFLHNGVR